MGTSAKETTQRTIQKHNADEDPEPVVWMDLTTKGIRATASKPERFHDAEYAIKPTTAGLYYKSKIQKNPWFEVDLGSARHIRSVEITAQIDYVDPTNATTSSV